MQGLRNVLLKLRIVILDEWIRLKLTSSHEKLYANFGKFIFDSEDSHADYRFAKLLTPIEAEFFQFLSCLFAYLWDIHSFKNNFTVSRSGYVYKLNQKFAVFSTLKLLFWDIKKKIIIFHYYKNLR